MLFFYYVHKEKKEEGFKSANITSLRFSFQGFVVLARRDMDKSTSLRGELVWFGLHNVILPSNPTYTGLFSRILCRKPDHYGFRIVFTCPERDMIKCF